MTVLVLVFNFANSCIKRTLILMLFDFRTFMAHLWHDRTGTTLSCYKQRMRCLRLGVYDPGGFIFQIQSYFTRTWEAKQPWLSELFAKLRTLRALFFHNRSWYCWLWAFWSRLSDFDAQKCGHGSIVADVHDIVLWRNRNVYHRGSNNEAKEMLRDVNASHAVSVKVWIGESSCNFCRWLLSLRQFSPANDNAEAKKIIVQKSVERKSVESRLSCSSSVWSTQLCCLATAWRRCGCTLGSLIWA